MESSKGIVRKGERIGERRTAPRTYATRHPYDCVGDSIRISRPLASAERPMQTKTQSDHKYRGCASSSGTGSVVPHRVKPLVYYHVSSLSFPGLDKKNRDEEIIRGFLLE